MVGPGDINVLMDVLAGYRGYQKGQGEHGLGASSAGTGAYYLKWFKT